MATENGKFFSNHFLGKAAKLKERGGEPYKEIPKTG